MLKQITVHSVTKKFCFFFKIVIQCGPSGVTHSVGYSPRRLTSQPWQWRQYFGVCVENKKVDFVLNIVLLLGTSPIHTCRYFETSFNHCKNELKLYDKSLKIFLLLFDFRHFICSLFSSLV